MRNCVAVAVIAAVAAAVLAGCGGGGGGATLSGRVIDGGTGEVLQGVRVALGASSAFSGTDGRFTLAGLSTGSGLLTAQLVGYEIRTVPVTIHAGANALPDDVKMAPVSGNPPGEPPRTIQGTITLIGESNASGVTVTLLAGAAQVDQMTTASDGKYYFWAPGGAYTVRAAKAGFVTQEGQVTVADLTKVVTLDLTLPRQ